MTEREPAIPALSTLLDDGLFAALLRERLPGLRIGEARANYVRFKPGTSALVAYDVEVDGERQPLYARASTRDPRALDKLRKVRGSRLRPSPLGPGRLLVEELALAIYAFPNDARLPILRRLLDDKRRAALLRRVVPEHPELWRARMEPLRWKPERRFVSRLDSPVTDTRGILKLYAGKEFDRAREGSRRFVSGELLRVPQPLGRSKRRRLIVLEWLEGVPYERLLDDAAAGPAAVARLGGALAELHLQRPEGLPRLDGAVEAERLVEAGRAVAVAGATTAERAQRLARTLSAELMSQRQDCAAVHGDFSIDQALLGEGGAAIVDLDEAALASPLSDLGSFAADLELRVLYGELQRSLADQHVAALIEGYGERSQRTIDRRQLVIETAAALLRRAVEPFRRRMPEWDRRVAAAIDRASELLSHAGGGRWHRAPAARSTQPLTSKLAELILDGAGARRLRVAPGRLSLRRAWPRGEGRVLLEYLGRDGLILAGSCSNRLEAPEPPVEAGADLLTLLRSDAPVPVVLQRHGTDPRLPGLSHAVGCDGATVIGHRALRRAVVRVRRGADACFVKVVRPGRIGSLCQRVATGAALADGRFTTPRMIALDRDLGLATFEAIPGLALSEALEDRQSSLATARSAGRVVRALHDAAASADLPEHGERQEVEVIQNWAVRLAQVDDDLGARVLPVAETVVQRVARLTGPRVPIHRDLHDGQLLLDAGGSVALLDLDTLAIGDPALDIGNLLVHLELLTLRGALAGARRDHAARALVAGYAPDDELLDRAAVYADATRVRLACVYGFRPELRLLALPLLALVGTALPLGEHPKRRGHSAGGDRRRHRDRAGRTPRPTP